LQYGFIILLVLYSCQVMPLSTGHEVDQVTHRIADDDGFEPLRQPVLGFCIEHNAERVLFRIVDDAGKVRFTGSLENCEKKLVDLLKEKYGTGNLNLPLATLGGKQFWGDSFFFHGWRIQQNVYTNHCRLLDRGDVRRAWGTYEACRTAFEAIRLEKGVAQSSDHLVVLLHGIGRSKDTFSALRDSLEREGYEVAAISYPSTRKSIREHSRQIQRILESLDGIRTVSFVTHSLGGIVARDLLSIDAEWRKRIQVHRMVMLAPPNQGSLAAEAMKDWFPYQFATGEAGQQLTPEEVAKIPVPDCEFAIIAGGTGTDEGYNPLLAGDDDGVVAVANTRLEGSADFLLLDVLHTFIMRDERSVKAILNFFAEGKFEPDDTVSDPHP